MAKKITHTIYPENWVDDEMEITYSSRVLSMIGYEFVLVRDKINDIKILERPFKSWKCYMIEDGKKHEYPICGCYHEICNNSFEAHTMDYEITREGNNVAEACAKIISNIL